MRVFLSGLFLPSASRATVEVWHSYGGNGGYVHINASANGALSIEDDYLFENDLPYLDSVMASLWREKKLEKAIFIFNIRPSFFPFAGSEGTVYVSDECYKLSGIGELPGERISLGESCYIADIYDQDAAHEKLLLAILGAQKLKGEVKSVNLGDLDTLRKEYKEDLAKFAGKANIVDPKWSGDGKYLLQSVWKDGAVSYEVTDVAAGKNIVLPTLGALSITDPRWSYDSRYVAYASGQDVMIYDLVESEAQTIELSQYTDDVIYDFSLSFNPADDILFFSFDVDYLNGYKSYPWHAKDKSVKAYRDDNTLPWLDAENLELLKLGLGNDAYDFMDATVSPAGNKLAVVMKGQDGLSTVRIIDKANEISADQMPVMAEAAASGNLCQPQNYVDDCIDVAGSSFSDFLLAAGSVVAILVLMILAGKIYIIKRKKASLP